MAYITASQRSSVQLLAKYRCRVCEVFKTNGCYSKKELNTYVDKYAAGMRPNEITARLRCRACAGGAIQELECGRCGIWKELNEFSKSARSAGGSKWCKTCVLWKEGIEPGISVPAAPAESLAPDEEANFFQQATGEFDDNVDDETDGGDFVADLGYGQSYAPLSTTGTANAAARDTMGSAPASSVLRGPLAGNAPVHRGGLDTSARAFISVPYDSLSKLTLQTSTNDSKIALGVSTGMPSSGYLPPHLRGKDGKPLAKSTTEKPVDLKSQTSASNTFETDSISSVLNDGWTAVDARRRQPAPPRPFTAWDNQGNAHSQLRVESVSENTPSQSQPRAAPVRPAVPALVRSAAPAPPRPVIPSPSPATPRQNTVTVRPTAPAATTPTRRLATAAVPTRASNSNWAKPVGTRKAVPPPFAPLKQNGNDYDDYDDDY